MSESIEDLRNENFRLKLRKGSHWQTNEIANFSMTTLLRIYHLEMDKVQTEKVIQSYKSELRKRNRTYSRSRKVDGEILQEQNIRSYSPKNGEIGWICTSIRGRKNRSQPSKPSILTVHFCFKTVHFQI